MNKVQQRVSDIRRSRVFGWVIPAFMALIFITQSGFTSDKTPSGPDRFRVIGHSYEGEFLIIQYYVPYPGMTSVNLYDGAFKCLWKGQYVDDKEGEHQIRLVASKLSPGISYMLEFDYKNQLNYLPVSAP